jgi:hypothetical protein
VEQGDGIGSSSGGGTIINLVPREIPRPVGEDRKELGVTLSNEFWRFKYKSDHYPIS